MAKCHLNIVRLDNNARNINRYEEISMNAWTCAALISFAGAVGGLVNAILSDNGFVTPKWRRGIWCPGFFANILVGAIGAFISWALYGSGAGVDIGQAGERALISLRFSALAGAFVVGIAGAKWLTSEVDKKLWKENVKVAGVKKLTAEECDELVQGSPMEVLDRLEHAIPAS
jgi:hypothetical protein